MRRIKTTVQHVVPGWNFCNNDTLQAGELTKHKCRFCVKQKDGYYCMLYDTQLSSRGGLVSKTEGCCKASAGYDVIIEQAPQTEVNPKDIMKHAVDLYIKTYNQYISDGYPDEMASVVAKAYVTGE